MPVKRLQADKLKVLKEPKLQKSINGDSLEQIRMETPCDMVENLDQDSDEPSKKSFRVQPKTHAMEQDSPHTFVDRTSEW